MKFQSKQRKKYLRKRKVSLQKLTKNKNLQE